MFKIHNFALLIPERLQSGIDLKDFYGTLEYGSSTDFILFTEMPVHIYNLQILKVQLF